MRIYTSGAVYVRIMVMIVEILQRQRKYKEAVKMIRYILDQNIYNWRVKGSMYERLTLNLHQHLKCLDDVSSKYFFYLVFFPTVLIYRL